MTRPLELLLRLTLLAALAVPAWAASPPDTPADAAASAPRSPVPALPVLPTLPKATPDDKKALLSIFNRPLVEFRAPLPGLSPADRVQRAQAQVRRHLERPGPDVVTLLTYGAGKGVLIDGTQAFWVLPGDVDPATGEDADPAQVVAQLQRVLAEAREASDVPAMLRALGLFAVSALLFGAFVWLLLRLRRWLLASLIRLAERHRGRLAVGGSELVARERLYEAARLLTTTAYWLVLAGVTSEWLGFAMRGFPYTRRWGEELHISLLSVFELVFTSIAESLPGLALAVVIFFLARTVLRLLKPLFAQVERGELKLRWVDQDTVRPTRTLVQVGVWLFALAMAYPYLPGAQTEAFKGISVMLGVMVSLGASSLFTQIIGGLIITYSHTMRIGEYVRVGEVEGTVMEIGVFATRVRTGMGSELTVPNSVIVGSTTINYSRAVVGHGYIVDTVLTIGYDTPWRQVHAMMIEGALRTAGVRDTPAPHVFQTALSDFYVEYRLVAQATASQPRPRAQVLADLHANLQDVFNENGVQIMSPHYLDDPQVAKIVPPAQWNPKIAPKA